MPPANAWEDLEPRLRELLDLIVSHARLRVGYTLLPPPEADTETGRIINFEGEDASLLAERHEDLLHAIEHLVRECLRLTGDHARLIGFDVLGRRQLRAGELAASARLAAEKVRRTGQPFAFSPMSARDRRIIHLALRDFPGVRTLSEGEARDRRIVIHPENPSRPVTARRRESRRL